MNHQKFKKNSLNEGKEELAVKLKRVKLVALLLRQQKQFFNKNNNTSSRTAVRANHTMNSTSRRLFHQNWASHFLTILKSFKRVSKERPLLSQNKMNIVLIQP